MRTIHDFMNYIPTKAQPEALEGENVRFHFDISGEQGGKYTLSVEDGDLSITEGLSGSADCVLSASDENLSNLLEGKLNPMMAMISGKIKMSNQMVMLKYAKTLGLM